MKEKAGMSWTRKRQSKVLLALSTMIVASIVTSNFLTTTPAAPPIALPPAEQLPEHPPSLQPQSNPELGKINKLCLEGVIIRSSGDTNPFLGTPWISVSCFGYVGTPIIASDVDIYKIYNTIKAVGLDYGQNIIYTGQEEYPADRASKYSFNGMQATKLCLWMQAK